MVVVLLLILLLLWALLLHVVCFVDLCRIVRLPADYRPRDVARARLRREVVLLVQRPRMVVLRKHGADPARRGRGVGW